MEEAENDSLEYMSDRVITHQLNQSSLYNHHIQLLKRQQRIIYSVHWDLIQILSLQRVLDHDDYLDDLDDEDFED